MVDSDDLLPLLCPFLLSVFISTAVELMFIISRFFEGCSRFQRTYKSLREDLERSHGECLPTRLDYTGQQHPCTYNELVRSYPTVTGRSLPNLLRAITMITSSSSLLGLRFGEQTTLKRRTESLNISRCILDRSLGRRPHFVSLHPALNTFIYTRLQPNSVIRGHQCAPYTAFWDKTSSHFITGADDGIVKVWSCPADRSSGWLVKSLRGHSTYNSNAIGGAPEVNVILDMCLSDNNKYLAAAGGDQRVTVWNTSDWYPVASLAVGKDISRVCFSPSSSDNTLLLLAACKDGKTRIYQSSVNHNGHLSFTETPPIVLNTSEKRGDKVVTAGFAATGRWFTVGGTDGLCWVHRIDWNDLQDNSIDAIIERGSTAERLSARPASASGRDVPRISLHTQLDGSSLLLPPVGSRTKKKRRTGITIREIKWSWTHEMFVSGCIDGTAKVWKYEKLDGSLAAGRWQGMALEDETPVTSSSTTTMEDETRSADINALASVSGTGGMESNIDEDLSGITAVAFTCDDQRVVTACVDKILHGVVRVHSAVDGSLLHTLTDHTAVIYVLDAHPTDSRIVLSASYDGRIIVWDVVSGIKLKELLSPNNAFPHVTTNIGPPGIINGVAEASALEIDISTLNSTPNSNVVATGSDANDNPYKWLDASWSQDGRIAGVNELGECVFFGFEPTVHSPRSFGEGNASPACGTPYEQYFLSDWSVIRETDDVGSSATPGTVTTDVSGSTSALAAFSGTDIALTGTSGTVVNVHLSPALTQPAVGLNAFNIWSAHNGDNARSVSNWLIDTTYNCPPWEVPTGVGAGLVDSRQTPYFLLDGWAKHVETYGIGKGLAPVQPTVLHSLFDDPVADGGQSERDPVWTKMRKQARKQVESAIDDDAFWEEPVVVELDHADEDDGDYVLDEGNMDEIRSESDYEEDDEDYVSGDEEATSKSRRRNRSRSFGHDAEIDQFNLAEEDDEDAQINLSASPSRPLRKRRQRERSLSLDIDFSDDEPSPAKSLRSRSGRGRRTALSESDDEPRAAKSLSMRRRKRRSLSSDTGRPDGEPSPARSLRSRASKERDSDMDLELASAGPSGLGRMISKNGKRKRVVRSDSETESQSAGDTVDLFSESEDEAERISSPRKRSRKADDDDSVVDSDYGRNTALHGSDRAPRRKQKLQNKPKVRKTLSGTGINIFGVGKLKSYKPSFVLPAILPEITTPDPWVVCTSSSISRQMTFLPQMRDWVVYIQRGHQEFADRAEMKLIFDVDEERGPVVFGRVERVEYVPPIANDSKASVVVWVGVWEFDEAVVSVLRESGQSDWTIYGKLTELDLREVKVSGRKDIIKLHYWHFDGPEFLIPFWEWKRGMCEGWVVGDRCAAMYEEGLFEGVVCQVGRNKSRNGKGPMLTVDDMWANISVRWDDGGMDSFSPWELYRPKSARSTPSLPTSLSDLLLKVLHSHSMNENLALFLHAPPYDEYPTYLGTVGAPRYFDLISTRLRAGFYRTVEGVLEDLELCERNAKLFNEAGSLVWKCASGVADVRKCVASAARGIPCNCNSASPAADNASVDMVDQWNMGAWGGEEEDAEGETDSEVSLENNLDDLHFRESARVRGKRRAAVDEDSDDDSWHDGSHDYDSAVDESPPKRERKAPSHGDEFASGVRSLPSPPDLSRSEGRQEATVRGGRLKKGRTRKKAKLRELESSSSEFEL
ncbi:hypothetical protein BC832DRAFT_620450 [Gaertneriomyces semiglobifer]|nr:hypothetical protein BC832DRAFT_620450 [Gaertneriomyces semiglobifer]